MLVYNIQDQLLNMFKEKIEHVQKSAVTCVNKALEEASAPSTSGMLSLGWAIKARSPQKRMTTDQRQYLINKFNDGQRSGHKHEPEDVAKDMRRARNRSHDPRFLPDDYLKPFQIKQYFSRLSAKSKKGEIRPAEEENDKEEDDTTEIPDVPTSDEYGLEYQLEELLQELID